MEHDTRWRSQLGQDRFAWLTLDRKRDGTFIDIGAGEPETISNTWTLETGFGWRGVLCDIEHAEQLRKLRNPSNDVEADAFAVDWRAHFRKWQRDGWIDFLSLDIEPPDMTAKLCSTCRSARSSSASPASSMTPTASRTDRSAAT